MKRRVVVTGMGAVTPIGNTVEEFWNGIKTGKVGIGPITKFDGSRSERFRWKRTNGFQGSKENGIVLPVCGCSSKGSICGCGT